MPLCLPVRLVKVSVLKMGSGVDNDIFITRNCFCNSHISFFSFTGSTGPGVNININVGTKPRVSINGRPPVSPPTEPMYPGHELDPQIILNSLTGLMGLHEQLVANGILPEQDIQNLLFPETPVVPYPQPEIPLMPELEMPVIPPVLQELEALQAMETEMEEMETLGNLMGTPENTGTETTTGTETEQPTETVSTGNENQTVENEIPTMAASPMKRAAILKRLLKKLSKT